MSDQPSMDPCPTNKRGRHHLAAVIPGEDDHDAVLFCEMCGATRHVSVLPLPRLDDFDAEDIARIAARDYRGEG